MTRPSKVRYCSVYPRVVGRCVEEVLRTVHAITIMEVANEEEGAEIIFFIDDTETYYKTIRNVR